MTYDETEKKKVLVRLAKNIDVEDISLELNVSVTTIYEWRKRYEAEIFFIKTSLEVRDLVRQKKYNEALEICSREEFLHNNILQSQRVTLLMLQKKYNKALEICSKEEFLNHEVMQSQRVTILIILKRYDEALEICSREDFLNDEPLQSQRITVLMIQRRYDEALEICNREEFLNSASLKNQKEKVLIQQGDYTLLLNKIKQREIIFDEIKTCNICPLEKIILTVALYEAKKYPQKISLNYLKPYFLEYENDNEALNILNLLKERLMQKNYAFDIEFYQYLIMKNKRIEERNQLLAVKENLNEHKNEEANNSLK